MIGIFRHRKRGSTYVVETILDVKQILDEGDHFAYLDKHGNLRIAHVQCSGVPTAGRHVVYSAVDEQDEEDRMIHMRNEAEFFDGRFEQV